MAILRPLFEGLDREQFLICGLDAKHKLIGINVVSTGSLNLMHAPPPQGAAPGAQVPAALQVSAPLQASPSAQVVPSSTGV